MCHFRVSSRYLTREVGQHAWKSGVECVFSPYRDGKSTRLKLGYGSTTPETSQCRRVLKNYLLDCGRSNGSSPVTSPVHFKMLHDVLEGSIPDRKTYEPLNIAANNLHHNFAHTWAAVTFVLFTFPKHIRLVKWVNIPEKRVRSACFPHIVTGNRVA